MLANYAYWCMTLAPAPLTFPVGMLALFGPAYAAFGLFAYVTRPR